MSLSESRTRVEGETPESATSTRGRIERFVEVRPALNGVRPALYATGRRRRQGGSRSNFAGAGAYTVTRA